MKIDFRRVFVIAGLAGLIVIYAAVWLGTITSPAQRTGADFIAFYAAGRVAQADGAGRAYDAGLQQAVQQEQVGFPLVPGQVLLYNHVPYLLPVLELVVDGSYTASFARWAILLLGVYAGAAWAAARLLGQRGLQRPEVCVLVAGMLTFYPLFVSLLNGQDTAFLFLGTVLWLAGLLLERDALAGLGLALTTVRPNIAAFLALPFLFRRRRVLLWFCLGAAVLGLASLWILGLNGTRAYLDVLRATAGGEWYGMNEVAMVNLVGLLRRIAPGLDAGLVRAAGWGAYLLGLAGICFWWARSRAIREKEAGLAVILAVFVAPHLHYHDLTLLLVPLLATILVLMQAGRLGPRLAALLPLALSLLLLLSNPVPALKFNLPILVMLLLALVLWRPEKVLRGNETPSI